MIDTSAYEFNVIIAKMDEDKNIQQIDFVNRNTKEVVKSYKYRAKKKKNSNTNQTINPEN